MKKFLMLMISALLISSLSACSFAGLDAQSLISPPSANEDQQAISALMQGDASDLQFVYPTSGDYRSAVIMHDLDGDGTEEAIAFCENDGSNITLMFMNELLGEWSIIDQFDNSATLVNKVEFGDMNGDGIDEIIVGWGSSQSLTASISIYKYGNQTINEYTLEYAYNEFTITDFDNDSVMELFTATIFIDSQDPEVEDQDAMARVFAFDERPVLAYSITLNNTVSKYTSASFMTVCEDQTGVVLESTLAEGGSITQLITMRLNKLNTPLTSDDQVALFNNFYRTTDFSLTSTDIDGDGVVEFPKLVAQSVSKDEGEVMDAVNYYVDWVKFVDWNYQEEVVKRTVMNTSENFMFEVFDEREIVCYKVSEDEYKIVEQSITNDGTLIKETTLFTIMLFTESEWSEEDEQDIYDKIFRPQSNSVLAVINEAGGNEDILNSISVITN